MKKFFKVFSLILALLLVIPLFMIIPSAAVTNDKIKAKQNEISALQNLLKEQSKSSENAKKKIEEIKNDIEQTEERKAELIEKISDLEEVILNTEELIKNYEELIALKEEEIDQTEKDLKSQEDSLVEFLRYDYESGSSSLKTIEFLLDSASLSDFLANIHYIGTLMDYQEHLMQTLESTGTKYEGQKYDLSVTKAEMKEYAAELTKQRDEADQLRLEAMEYIMKLEASELEYEAELESSKNAEAELEKQIKAAQEEEAKLIEDEIAYQKKLEEERKRKEEEERKKREAEEAARKAREAAEKAAADKEAEARAKLAEANAAAYGNGGYLWPLPMNSGFHISGWFGYEPNPIGSGIRFHKAYDIAVSGGTAIYASRAGKVITAKYSSSYGNYVVILHSDGYSTLYAHASKLLVKVGQTVEQGDTIAKVGTTGYSTGNHLHFEIIQPDGRTREDPWYYFEKLSNMHIKDSPRYDNLNKPRPRTYKV